MATTLPPEHEAEFERRWCRAGQYSTEVDAWLPTLGIKFDSEAYATRNALYRPWSNHPTAIADRTAIRWLSEGPRRRPADNPVRKPTPEEHAARRVPRGGFKLGGSVARIP